MYTKRVFWPHFNVFMASGKPSKDTWEAICEITAGARYCSYEHTDFMVMWDASRDIQLFWYGKKYLKSSAVMSQLNWEIFRRTRRRTPMRLLWERIYGEKIQQYLGGKTVVVLYSNLIWMYLSCTWLSLLFAEGGLSVLGEDVVTVRTDICKYSKGV